MSYVNASRLRAVNDPVIPTWSLPALLTGAGHYTVDTVSQYGAYWKSATIRNFDTTAVLAYRELPTGLYQNIPPAAERTLAGWGSYLSIRPEQQGAKNGNLVLELASVEEVEADG